MCCHWDTNLVALLIKKQSGQGKLWKLKLRMHFVCIFNRLLGKVNSSLFLSLCSSLSLLFLVFSCLVVSVSWDPADCSLPGWLCCQIIAIVYCLNAFPLLIDGLCLFKNYSQCLAYSSCSINIQTKSFICSNRDYEKAVLHKTISKLRLRPLFLI